MAKIKTCKSCGCELVKGENQHADWCPHNKDKR